MIGSSDVQEDVYTSAVGDAVRLNIYRGYNTTIITYEQKNNRKAFTMYGTNIDCSNCDHSKLEKESATG